MAGRDRPSEGDAVGRPLAITWFDMYRSTDTEDGEDTIVVQRVDTTVPHMHLLMCTIAELLRSSGHYPVVGDNDSARDVEIKLESMFLDFELTVYTHVRVPVDRSGGDPFVFELRDPLR